MQHAQKPGSEHYQTINFARDCQVFAKLLTNDGWEPMPVLRDAAKALYEAVQAADVRAKAERTKAPKPQRDRPNWLRLVRDSDSR